MKSTGMIRKVDELGRIVLPIEIREAHDIHPRDPLEISVDGEMIILSKYSPACYFCGKSDVDMVEYREKRLCKSCLQEIKSKL